MLVLDFLYFLLLLLAWPFWLKYVLKRSYRSLLKDRLHPGLAAAPGKSVWIHAVSVGEVRSLKSLVQALGENGNRVVLSVTTPAGFDLACKEFPGLAVIHSPLDLSFVVRRFIVRIQPRLVIFNELEIWPNWISLLHRRCVPMLLINGRISKAAFSRYRVFGIILRPFFRSMDGYLVQSELYRERFLRLGIPAGKISVCGNIKADEADNRLKKMPAASEVRAHLRLGEQCKKIVVLASSHGSDEEVFIPPIPAHGDDFFFIIVPRHVQRAPGIAARLQRLGVRPALFSRQKTPDAGIQALVFDRMGYLFPIMSIADIVFMGGTFDPKIGGHNLYEPAVMAKAIVGGPHYDSFADIGRELEASGAYHRLNDSRAWRDYLDGFNEADAKKAGAGAREAITRRKGALACSLEQIRRYLA